MATSGLPPQSAPPSTQPPLTGSLHARPNSAVPLRNAVGHLPDKLAPSGLGLGMNTALGGSATGYTPSYSSKLGVALGSGGPTFSVCKVSPFRFCWPCSRHSSPTFFFFLLFFASHRRGLRSFLHPCIQPRLPPLHRGHPSTNSAPGLPLVSAAASGLVAVDKPAPIFPGPVPLPAPVPGSGIMIAARPPPAVDTLVPRGLDASSSGGSAGVGLGGLEGGDQAVPLEEGALQWDTTLQTWVVRRGLTARTTHPDRLNLDGRRLTTCCVIEGETRLRLLNYENNWLTRVSNMHGLPSLIFLDLYNNRLTDISGLAAVPTLRVLMLGKNQLARLDGLASLTQLDVLDLHANHIDRLDGLATLKSLRVLNLAGNNVTCLSGVAGLDNLVELNVRRNAIERLDAADLVGIGRWQRLFLSGNALTDIDALKVVLMGSSLATSLHELSLDGNPLAADPRYALAVVEACRNLQHLDQRRVSDDEKRQGHLLRHVTATAAAAAPRDSALAGLRTAAPPPPTMGAPPAAPELTLPAGAGTAPSSRPPLAVAAPHRPSTASTAAPPSAHLHAPLAETVAPSPLPRQSSATIPPPSATLAPGTINTLPTAALVAPVAAPLPAAAPPAAVPPPWSVSPALTAVAPSSCVPAAPPPPSLWGRSPELAALPAAPYDQQRHDAVRAMERAWLAALQATAAALGPGGGSSGHAGPTLASPTAATGTGTGAGALATAQQLHAALEHHACYDLNMDRTHLHIYGPALGVLWGGGRLAPLATTTAAVAAAVNTLTLSPSLQGVTNVAMTYIEHGKVMEV